MKNGFVEGSKPAQLSAERWAKLESAFSKNNVTSHLLDLLREQGKIKNWLYPATFTRSARIGGMNSSLHRAGEKRLMIMPEPGREEKPWGEQVLVLYELPDK